jgi:hypothetical protein
MLFLCLFFITAISPEIIQVLIQVHMLISVSLGYRLVYYKTLKKVSFKSIIMTIIC